MAMFFSDSGFRSTEEEGGAGDFYLLSLQTYKVRIKDRITKTTNNTMKTWEVTDSPSYAFFTEGDGGMMHLVFSMPWWHF